MEQAEEVSDLTRENPYLVSSRDTSDHMELLDHVMKITMVNYMIANHEYETVIEIICIIFWEETSRPFVTWIMWDRKITARSMKDWAL